MINSLQILLVTILCAAAVFAQNPSSAVWPLTANQMPVVSGEITAFDQQLSSMQVSYSSSVQRSSPTGTAGTWTAESAENPTRYMQFTAAPKSNNDLTVTSVSLKLSVNSGSGMKANVYYSTDSTFANRTQIGTTLALSGTVPSAPNVSGTPNITVPSGGTFYVRIYPWYNTATTGKYVITNTVTVTGTTISTIAPIISASVTSLPPFEKAVVGTSVQGSTYSVSGLNLASDIVVAAPKGFAVSKDSSVYADSISFAPSAGTVTNATVFTRFVPAAAEGLTEDAIVHTSAGAVQKTVAVTGVSLAVQPGVQSSMSLSNLTGNSVTVTVSGGDGMRRIIAARKDSTVTFQPVDGSEISGVDSNFSAALIQGNGNIVVFDGSASSVTITGLSVATTYHFAVFEYNVGSGNSHNYTVSPGTATATTLAVPGISAAPVSLSFGNTVVNTVSKEKSFLLSAAFLSPVSGAVTLTATNGFRISMTAASGFDSVITVPYTGASIAARTVFVRFMPAATQPYTGTIAVAGGGSSAATVSVSGTGVDQIIVPDSIPFGFASLGGGTTGGAGGTAVIITSGQQLADIMLPREKTGDPGNPLILYISGTVSGYGDEVSIKRTKNISIIGMGSDAKVQGFGFKIVESSNIIVRNITFADAKAGEKDAVSVEESHNVWVDHCSFTDSPSIDLSGGSHDGQLDVKKGSYNVTLSYNYFTNHRKTCLLGHSPSETGDVALRVTYYRNWFDGTYSRHPRARYGKAHIINNLYTSAGVVGADKGGYGVGSTCGASLLVEANYFEGTSRPTLISQVNDPEETLSGDPIGYLKAVNNFAENSGPIVESLSGYSFEPSESYTYTPLDAALVKNVVMASAGAGKLDGGGPTSVTVSGEQIPSEFRLYQNFPNPFNPSTTIQFTVQRKQQVTLSVYNAIGQRVETLYSGVAEEGRLYSARLDGRTLTSGMYFTVLESGAQRQVNRILLMK